MGCKSIRLGHRIRAVQQYVIYIRRKLISVSDFCPGRFLLYLNLLDMARNACYINIKKHANRAKGIYMNIKELRKSIGLSQAKFSDQFGIPKRTLQDWESGSRKPPQYVMSLLESAILAKVAETGTGTVEISFDELTEIAKEAKRQKSTAMKNMRNMADRLGLASNLEFTMHEYDPDTDINGFIKSAEALGANVKVTVTADISDASETDPDTLSRIAHAYGLESALSIDPSSIKEMMQNLGNNSEDHNCVGPGTD